MIKKQNDIYKNEIRELENKIKNLESKIKEKDNKINEYNKIQELKNVSNDNNYINKIRELENKINELENKIKNLELIIKEKDNKINEYNKIKEFKNVSNDNNNYINRIKELEIEIEKYKNYFLSPGEKLITINFISIDQTINFYTFAKKTDNFAKKTDIFAKLEISLYEYYPQYKDTENYFLVNGKKINKHRTIADNKINDNDILTLGIFDE